MATMCPVVCYDEEEMVATEKSSPVATGKVLETGCFDSNPRVKLLQSLTTWIEISEIKKKYQILQTK